MNRKERTILVVILINAALIVIKYWLSSASGSLSLRASAVHTLSDAAVSVFVLLGLLLARTRLMQNRFKTGASRVESLLALGVAVAIFYVGFDIVGEVLAGKPQDLTNIGWVALVSFITIPAAFLIARYLRYVGKHTGSPALMASSYHAQMDIYASIVVVAGLAGAALGIPSLDRAAAAIVVVFVLFAGYEIISSAWHALTAREVQEQGSEELAGVHLHVGRASPSRLFIPVAAFALVGMYLVSGFYVVNPGEFAVVRRFGRVIASDIGPGLQYRLPWPFEQADIVNVSLLRRAETPSSLMLTGDENLIAIRLSLHYAVKDAVSFLLNTADPETLVAQAADTAMRQVVAQEGVDALITTDKAAIQQQAAALTQRILDDYSAGIQVASVQLLQSDPPPEVADAFRDVASAREDRNTFINEALAYQNEVLPVARGDAETAVQAARAYRAEKLASANGEAEQFASRQGAYAQAPGVTRTRLYLEAVERVLPGMRKFLISEAVKLQTTDLTILYGQNVQPFPPQP
ncbi:MAG: FtsH protease activity modulator HflK [Chloroflexi bacterium]|nr:FtsH protease activity modulator HflK [Chloroflexota bacterium]